MKKKKTDEVKADVEAKQVALLDEAGVFIGMVDKPDVLTELHIAEITECNLPPHRYI